MQRWLATISFRVNRASTTLLVSCEADDVKAGWYSISEVCQIFSDSPQFFRKIRVVAQSWRLFLQRFSLVHKSRLLSVLAPPSFSPFRSLKTRLQYLLLPTVASPLYLKPSYSLYVPSFLQLCYLMHRTNWFSWLLFFAVKRDCSQKSIIIYNTRTAGLYRSLCSNLKGEHQTCC